MLKQKRCLRANGSSNDWVMVHDEDDSKRSFPQIIVHTPLRPDIVVYSKKYMVCVMIELTVGDESNFENQRMRKEIRYQQLLGH